MKKLLTLLLLLASVLAALAACVEAVPEGNDAVSSEAESTEPAHLDNIPDDLKFNGEDIVILSRSMQG